MPDAAGTIVDMQADKTTIVLPEDIELTYWPGGKRVTEVMQNNDLSQTRKVGMRGGCIKGISARLTKNGAIKAMVDMIIKAAEQDLDFIFTLANGDKFSGAITIVADDDFFTNTDGLGKMEIYAMNGSFNPVS